MAESMSAEMRAERSFAQNENYEKEHPYLRRDFRADCCQPDVV